MAGGIRSLDSFMENYSEPAWLDEKPQSFASALKEWQQIQGNYYKNDKAKMELEDKEESREKKKEREKKMLELGLTLDPDDLRGSLRKVIDFSNGEGDINTSLNIMGRLYQMDKAEKREREAAARKALGITKKEQAKLEKAAQNEKINGYLRDAVAGGGFTQDAIRNAAVLAMQNGDLDAVKAIGSVGKTFFGTGSNGNSSKGDWKQGLAAFFGVNNDIPVNLSTTTTKPETPLEPATAASESNITYGDNLNIGQRYRNKNTGKYYIKMANGKYLEVK